MASIDYPLVFPVFTLAEWDQSRYLNLADRDRQVIPLFTDREICEKYLDEAGLRWDVAVEAFHTPAELFDFLSLVPNYSNRILLDPLFYEAPAWGYTLPVSRLISTLRPVVRSARAA